MSMVFRFLFAFLLMAPLAQAEPNCTPTARVTTSNYPGAENIPPTNNLLLPTGKSLEAEAQKLIITGRLVDRHCMPIPEATVEIWQLNPFGKWYLAEDEELVTPNAVFAGAGRAITDNEGYFTFVTGFPGVTTFTQWQKRKKVTVSRAPRVFVRVRAEGFSKFNTALFFDGDHRNMPDAVYKRLKPDARTSVTFSMGEENGTLVASKEIVLSGDAPYRSY